MSLCATPGALERQPARLRRRDFQKIALPARRVAHRLARAKNVNRLLLQVARTLRRGDHQRAAAVADDAAIEQMQRRRDDARREHVLHGDRVAILRGRIHRRMQAHRDRDFGELRRGRPVVMHMALRDHRVRPDRRRPERNLVLVARVACEAAGSAARADRKPRATPRSSHRSRRIRRTARRGWRPPRARYARRTTSRRSKSSQQSSASGSGNRRSRRFPSRPSRCRPCTARSRP